VVYRPYLQAHREAVLGFLRATIEGNYLAVSDAARAKPVLARELDLTDPKIVDLSYANFKSETPLDAELTREGAANVIEIVAQPGMSSKLEDYIDSSLHEQLKQEGFFARMKEKYGMR
jgi:hypothetical protein